MGFIRGEAREQVSLFPATLDELIPEDHACRVIEALVNRLEMSIAEFRRMHLAAVTEAGAELVQLARAAGLVKGEWVAIDGSKFRAVSSASRVRERDAMK